VKPEPITVMIFVMRLTAAAGAYVLSKLVPDVVAWFFALVAQAMALMSIIVVFGHLERSIGEYLLKWMP
jgi:hypothetical protein